MPHGDPPVLGLVAGQGQFPALVAAGAKAQGWGVAAVGFAENTTSGLAAETDWFQWLKLGQLGKLVAFFRTHGVRQVVFAGAINKPRALDIRPDFRAARLLWNLRSKSDNTLLTAVAGELRREGMEVVSALRFVPELQTPAGQLTKRGLSRREQQDLEYGWPIAKAIGRMDIGQCVVVREQMVVAVEGLEGTNAMLKRAGDLGGRGGMAIKIFKPGQEEAIDQPSVGLSTVETMLEAGLTSLVVEAHTSLFFDRDASVALANRHGLCLYGRSDGQDGGD
ncbi:LpxI family protein [Desulfohalobium retbaense]|uniref:UDP-2,3-diacylglucosamine pyrophosphatase n=1 Tax=Desulfohalobium retbaense (strain ATCC 49708 / DSM 5692 / JCM 16813 / HR100) TaxID=485915 RepID=C8X513_DESRD|nr:UDP-2,3-diacylglucosamine diphosphatase LpxI [Desulfohalobium retbaense]ACV69510.1 protein of unknown function DUF1009 [Desulfohalobium retbaense DSM 5692]